MALSIGLSISLAVEGGAVVVGFNRQRHETETSETTAGRAKFQLTGFAWIAYTCIPNLLFLRSLSAFFADYYFLAVQPHPYRNDPRRTSTRWRQTYHKRTHGPEIQSITKLIMYGLRFGPGLNSVHLYHLGEIRLHLFTVNLIYLP